MSILRVRTISGGKDWQKWENVETEQKKTRYLRKIPSWPKCLVNWVEKQQGRKENLCKNAHLNGPTILFLLSLLSSQHSLLENQKNRTIHTEAKAEGSSPDNVRVTIETWRDGWSNRGMCECWRHTATYLTYWLCVKSHPLNMAARCVAMVIYSRASSLTLPRCGREYWSTLYPLALSSLSAAYPQLSTIKYCFGKNAGWLHIADLWWKPWINHSVVFLFFLFLLFRSTSMEQNLQAVTGPRHILCTQNVTGLNPACDLFWMSYPRCIQSCSYSATVFFN